MGRYECLAVFVFLVHLLGVYVSVCGWWDTKCPRIFPTLRDHPVLWSFQDNQSTERGRAIANGVTGKKKRDKS